MTTPTHVAGAATLVSALNGAVVTAVQPLNTYPGGALYPSGATFPGQGYITVGVGGAALTAVPPGVAVLAPEALAAAAIQTT